MVAVVCLIVGAGVLALREPHTAPTRGPIRITKPAVPEEIRTDFWFSALGAMASWSVLGVLLLSLYPSLAARQTHIDNLVFGGAVVEGHRLRRRTGPAGRHPPARQVFGDHR